LKQPAILALEDGSLFKGISIGITGQTVGEVVFNTAMTGYQEILTDPSYAKQIITLTYPHIGNVGVNTEDEESDRIWAAGLIIRNLSPYISNWRAELPLDVYLKKNHIVAISEIDTRQLTRILRKKGALNGCIWAGNDFNCENAIKKARAFPGLNGMDLVKEVSTKKFYSWTEGRWDWKDGYKKYAVKDLPWHVIVYDFGVKRNILRMLVNHGCRLTVVPATTPIEEVLKLMPDGLFLSNGPGDPAACHYAINAICSLEHTNLPLFGICLGHQLLALSFGAETVKMKFGHHGANHPVSHRGTKQVLISTQNHGFVVDEATLPTCLEATSHSLFDGSLQGIQHTNMPWFGFQGHPEASPGPHDMQSLFNHFIQLMKNHSGTTHGTTK
jgi:carbamoyl-phosphate synthase small subunit